ncbi:substrate-binding domain-containing protein, partial [Promicromonospora kroppenstedtii]|uniref:substrate-binding domain-containing protein n=1 Tax=Promicromonospora kroppenstedtii TaxID=440482 RepID=UPI0006886581
GLRLTEAGRLLADGGREVSRTVAQVQARWDEFMGSASGTVRVATLPSAATVLLPGVLERLASTGVTLECTDMDIAESEYSEMVADHDIVIGHSFTGPVPAGAGHLVTAALLREPLDIALRAGHPLASKTRVTARDLVAYEWYGVPLGYPFDGLRIAVETTAGQPVRVAQRLRDNRLIEALVAASDRVGVLPRYSTAPGAGLVLRPVHGMDAARWIVAILRPDHAERLAVRTALEAFRAVGQEVVR